MDVTHTMKKERVVSMAMVGPTAGSRAVLLATLMLLSTTLCTFSASATEAEIALDPWALIDSSKDVRNAQVTTAGEDLVMLTYIEEGSRLEVQLLSAAATSLPNVLVTETSGVIQSLAVATENCERTNICNLHIAWTIHGGNQQTTGLWYSLHSIDSINRTISSLTQNQKIVNRENLRDVAMEIDSKGGIHIAWTDNHDTSGILRGTDQIRYTMLQIIPSQGTQSGSLPMYADALISDTLLTTNYGSKGHPSIAIDSDDHVAIAWDDVRGSSVEMLFVMPTPSNGYMNGEWSDVCTVLYGGTYDQGSMPSLKEVADDNGILLMETIYGLHDTIPTQANQNNCAGKNTNQNSRSTPLSSSDDSGGIRKLQDGIYNGQTPSPWWKSERDDWGPGTTWACMSWRDANGNTGSQANPPTSSDHRWNEVATRIVVPFGVEGPYEGDPIQNSDRNSIAEAHRRCLDGDTLVAPVYAYPVSNPSDVLDSMIDLAWCPDSGVNTQSRNCPGTSTTNRNMSSGVISWRQTNGALTDQWGALSDLLNTGSRDIWMTALDPWNFLDNSATFVNGTSATIFDSNTRQYVERIGPASTGSLVIVNDTVIVENDAISIHPKIEFDLNEDLHVVWTDGWTHSSIDRLPTEILHQRLDLPDLSVANGFENGLDSSDMGPRTTLVPTNISVVESGTPSVIWSDAYADVNIDQDGTIHVAWIDAVRVNGEDQIIHATLIPPTNFPGGAFGAERMIIGNDGADKNGPRPTSTAMDGEAPSIAVTGNGITMVSYTAVGDCTSSSGSNHNVCIGRLAPSLHEVRRAQGQSASISIEPGQTSESNIEVAIREGTGLAQVKVDLSTLEPIGCDGWTTEVRFTQNGTVVNFPMSDVIVGVVPLQMTVRFTAPISADLVDGATCERRIIATDGPLSAGLTVVATLDVIRMFDVRAMQSKVAIEQGQSGGVSVEFENTGNVPLELSIRDPSTTTGIMDWLKPSGWDIQFPESIDIDPGQTTSSYATISVPLDQISQEVDLQVVARSNFDSSPSIEEGTMSFTSFTIDVKIRRAGNIVLDLFDSQSYPAPGECDEFNVQVQKNYADGQVRFDAIDPPLPGDGFTVEYNLENLPGNPTESQELPYASLLQRNGNYELGVILCAEEDAAADTSWIMGISASLVQDPSIGDDVQFGATVATIRDLDIEIISGETFVAEPGQREEFTVYVKNNGNTIEPIDPYVTLNDKIPEGFQIQFAENTLLMLQPSQETEIQGYLTASEDAAAGENTLLLYINSETEPVAMEVEIPLRIDMQMEFEGSNLRTIGTESEAIWTLVIRNAGNAPDSAKLSFHNESEDGILAEEPSSDALPGFILSLHEGSLLDTNVGAGISISDDGFATLGPMSAGAEKILHIRATVDMEEWPEIGIDKFGVRINSQHGGKVEGGDLDSTPGWIGPDFDLNEKVLLAEFEAMDLQIGSVTQIREGDNVELTITVQNLGNADGDNILLLACPDVSPTGLVYSGCPAGQVKGTLPSIQAVDGNTIGERRVTISIDASTGTEWVLLVDPDERLPDVDRTNNILTVEIEENPEKGGLSGIIDSSEGSVAAGIVAALGAVLGGLMLMLLVSKTVGRKSRKRDRWASESRAWGTPERPPMDSVPTASAPMFSATPPPASLGQTTVAPAQTQNSNDPYSDLDDMNIGDLLGDLL